MLHEENGAVVHAHESALMCSRRNGRSTQSSAGGKELFEGSSFSLYLSLLAAGACGALSENICS